MIDGDEKPLVIVGSDDYILSAKIGKLLADLKLLCIRTNNLERIISELKRPGRFGIMDMNWEGVQQTGVLRRLINIGAITDNKLVCICPNKDEDLKKMAKRARPAEVFLRYDLDVAFKEYLANL